MVGCKGCDLTNEAKKMAFSCPGDSKVSFGGFVRAIRKSRQRGQGIYETGHSDR